MTDPPTWDAYAILGVRRDASPLQVARAHRLLAKRHHPDLNPDAADQRAMHRINQAWRVLSIPALRAEYDRRHPDAGMPAARRKGASAGSPAASSRPGGGHWTATREPIRRDAVNARSYREWRVSAGHAAAAMWPSAHGYPRPGTGALSGVTTAASGRRVSPNRVEAAPARSFRDSGWAAILVAGILVAFLLLVAGLGSEYRASVSRDAAPAPFELKHIGH
ncbi:MAG: J domain-containing protein [Candidatus Limnocylindria bacterium]